MVEVPLGGAPKSVVEAQVLRLGRLRPNQIIRKLHTLYAGNKYWVASRVAPDLSSSLVLQWLGVIHNQRVRFVLKYPSGKIRTVMVPLTHKTLAQVAPTMRKTYQKINNALQSPPGIHLTTSRYFAWAINTSDDYGVFWLNRCRNTVAYQRSVNSFFNRVQADNITHVVWDLQDNSGGNALVIYPWIEHVNGPTVLKGYNGSVILPSRKTISGPYSGKFYVLVNATTFSASVMDVEILAANHMATIVGEPTGLGPNGFGNVVSTLINGFVVQTSTVKFTAPGNNHAAAIDPQITIPVTVNDALHGVNAIASWMDHRL